MKKSKSITVDETNMSFYTTENGGNWGFVVNKFINGKNGDDGFISKSDAERAAIKYCKTHCSYQLVKKEGFCEIWVRFWCNAGWGFKINRIDKPWASSLAGFKNPEEAIKVANETIEQKSCYLTC